MKQVTVSGRTNEEAIEKALHLLQVSKEKVESRVIVEGKKGFLGIGAKRAVLQVTVKKTIGEQAERYLRDISSHFISDVHVIRREKGKKVQLQLETAEPKVLIGKQGRTLNALQDLVQLYVHSIGNAFCQVELDIADYRRHRKEAVRLLAHNMADTAVQSGRKAALEPMPSFERKIVHAALQRRDDVQTSSRGKEPHRHIIIEPRQK